MKLVKKFKINKDSSIKIAVPALKDKFNRYYKPTKELQIFDHVKVIFCSKDKCFTIYYDDIQSCLIQFQGSLKLALKNKMSLPDFINIGSLGYHYNNDMNVQGMKSVNYSTFWLWSSANIQTWLYNKDSKIYIEIIPSYPWLFANKKKGEKYITFKKFMEDYKPIAVEEINRSIAEQWLNQCNTMLTELESQHKKMLQQLSKSKSIISTLLQQKNINLKGGEVTFSDFDISIEKSLQEQKNKFKENNEIQITYKIDNKTEYLVQVEWNKVDEKGVFTTRIFRNFDWEKPIFQKTTSDIDDVFHVLQEAINVIDQDRCIIAQGTLGA
jgi:hypothetical protein